jgi:hypothetical protein
MHTNVSEEHAASIFRVEVFLYPEDEESKIPANTGTHLPNYMQSVLTHVVLKSKHIFPT